MPVDGTVPEKNRGCQVLFLFLFLFYADKVTCTLHDYRNVIDGSSDKRKELPWDKISSAMVSSHGAGECRVS